MLPSLKKKIFSSTELSHKIYLPTVTYLQYQFTDLFLNNHQLWYLITKTTHVSDPSLKTRNLRKTDRLIPLSGIAPGMLIELKKKN